MKDRIDLLKYEKNLYDNNISLIAGVDEAGRGPLFGPVVAAAVIFPKDYNLAGLNDSKQLSAKKRDLFFDIIKRDALAVGVGVVSAERIDKINIYQAAKEAMMLALDDLKIVPEHVLVDAMPLDLEVPSTSIIHGDALSLSIAGASVIAKVTRDRIMEDYDQKFPEYEFKKHKGYPTKQHIANVKKYGLISGYRFTFHPICDLIINGGK